MAPFQYTPAPGSGGGGAASSGITTVGLVVPSVLAVAGSPLSTPGGTLTVTLNTGVANQFLAAPSTGNGQIGLRIIASGDIPTLAEAQISGLSTDLSNRPTGVVLAAPAALYITPVTGVVSGGVVTVTPIFANQAANSVFLVPSTGGLPSFNTLTSGYIPTISESQVSSLVSDLSSRPTGIVLSLPTGLFSSPITGVNSAGISTLTPSFQTFGPSNILAGPTTGNGIPTIRQLTMADEVFQIPNYGWTPRDILNGVMWLTPTIGNLMWKENPNTGAGMAKHPQATGDVIGVVQEVVGSNYIYAGTSGSSPTLASDSVQLTSFQFSSSNNTLFQIDNSKTLFSFMWGSGQLNWTILAKLKFLTNGVEMGIFDMTGGGGGSTGVSLDKNSNNTFFFSVGASGGLLSTFNTTLTITDTNWHYLIISSNGTNIIFNIDGTTESHAITVGKAVAPNTPALQGPFIGQEFNSSHPFNGLIGDFFVASGDLTAQDMGNDIQRWLNYNPTFHFNSPSRLAINGNFAHNSGTLTALSGYRNRGLSPLQVAGIYDWTDYTDLSKMWTTALSISGHGPTGVVSHNDKVGFVENKIGPQFLRASYNMTPVSCPVWHTGALPNGEGCVFWSGHSPAVPSTGTENMLQFNAWPDASKTFFVVFNTPQTGNIGCHLLSDGTAYTAIGGTGDIANTNEVVQHFGTVYAPGGVSAAIAGDAKFVNPNGWNIVEVVQDGTIASLWINGNWIPIDALGNTGSTNVAGRFVPDHIGRPQIIGWDILGSVAHKACILGNVDAETRRRVRAYLSDSIGGINNVNLSY